MDDTAATAPSGAAAERVPCTIHGMEEANMPTEALAKMACSHGAVMGLLLTWLGVGAHHGPRSFHRRPRRQKLWRACSCSSTSLLLRKSSTNGELPSEASSASPTKTSRGQRGPRAGAPSSHRTPVVEGPEVPQPRCTLLLHASRRGCRSVVMMLVIIFP
jgi:hypothetical protein